MESRIADRRSVFGKALADVLEQNLDENCDRLNTDREMFDQMKAHTDSCVWLGADFRFRSSAWSDIPLVLAQKEAGTCQACRERVRAKGVAIGVVASFLDQSFELDREAYARMIGRPHIFAHFANAVPAQVPANSRSELVTLVDPSWSQSNALGALTPIRMLVYFDSGPTSGDPCLTPKWFGAGKGFAPNVRGLLLPERAGNQVRFAIGGPSESTPVGVPTESLRAVACPYDFDVGQCFEVAHP